MSQTYAEFYKAYKDELVSKGVAIDETSIATIVGNLWDTFFLGEATSAVVKLKRGQSVYADPLMAPWIIEEVLSGITPESTYSSVEKARAGDVQEFQIAKAMPDQQMIFGWANIAVDAQGFYPLDWDGDVTSPTSLENAAYTYVLKYRTAGEAHEGEAVGQLIESVMFTKEKQQALGIPDGLLPQGWWVGFHIPDKEVFAKAKNGEYGMFSVQGKAKRLPTGQ